MTRLNRKQQPLAANVVVFGESGVGKTCLCDMVLTRPLFTCAFVENI